MLYRTLLLSLSFRVCECLSCSLPFRLARFLLVIVVAAGWMGCLVKTATDFESVPSLDRRRRRRRTSSSFSPLSYHTLLIIVCNCACFSLHFISLYVFRISRSAANEGSVAVALALLSPSMCVSCCSRSEATTFFPRLKINDSFFISLLYPTPIAHAHIHTHT